MIKKIIFTKEGLENLKKELQDLETQRKEAVFNLKTAREMGDLSENAAYKAARSKLSSIDHRIRYLKKVISQAQVVSKSQSDVVDIGSYVTISTNGETIKYQIVGSHEADLTKNKISNFSPIGHALINHKVNDIVEIMTPSGKIYYKIIDVDNS